jgi:hypothetical protein
MIENTLVTHKKIQSLGIGCISKVLSKFVKVNFGLSDTKTCSTNQLNLVDVSNCKTVPFNDFRNRILQEKSDLNIVIVGNEVKEFVGIGWMTLRVVQLSDLLKYPRVV